MWRSEINSCNQNTGLRYNFKTAVFIVLYLSIASSDNTILHRRCKRPVQNRKKEADTPALRARACEKEQEAGQLVLPQLWSRRGPCTLGKLHQQKRFREIVLRCFRAWEAKQREATRQHPPRLTPLRACADRSLTTSPRAAHGFLPDGRAEDARARARAQRRLPCPLCVPASLPATRIASFRPGKASWGLTILEVVSPILGARKRLWKSLRALLVATSMGGRVAEGPPGGTARSRAEPPLRRRRAPGGGTGVHWAGGLGSAPAACAADSGRCRPGIEVTQGEGRARCHRACSRPERVPGPGTPAGFSGSARTEMPCREQVGWSRRSRWSGRGQKESLAFGFKVVPVSPPP